MKRKLSIAGIFCLTLLILLGLTAYLMTRYIDPNKYKGRISQYVYAKTGQVLVINGNMEWSFFPWVGLKANRLTYYNAPDFTPKTFISAKEMDVKVKLMPLLHGKIEVGNITLDHAVLNLIKNSSGKYNWETLAKHDNEDKKDLAPNKTVANLTIQSLKIKNSKLNWYDVAKHSHTTFADLNISSKNLQFGQAFPLTVAVNLLDDKNKKNIGLDLQTDLMVSNNYQQYSFSNLNIKTDYYLPQQTLAIKIQGNANADLTAHSINTQLNIALQDLNMKVDLTGSTNPNINLAGTLTTDEFDLKDLLACFDTAMHTKNDKSLRKVTLLSKIAVNDKKISLSQLHAKVDQSDVFGNLTILTDSKTYRFNLNTNKIDIDDFVSADSKTSDSSNVEATTPKNKAAAPWNLAGSFKIDNLKADKLILSDVTGNVIANKNTIRLSPLRASFYKGTLDGTVSIDKHDPNKTAYYIKESAHNVDIKELLHELSDSDKLSGTTNIDTNLVSVVGHDDSFLSNLNGKIQLSVLHGSLQGVDVIYQLSRAHAFVKRLSTHGLSDSKQTSFSSLTTSGDVNNGVISMNDLALTSDYLKVNGKGTTNLVNKDIHYRLNALAQPKLAAENDQIGKEITIYQVPIKVSGKISKPSVNLDFAELAKTFLAKEIQKPLEDKIGKNINNLKNNLKDKVSEKLKSISPVSLLNKLTKQDAAPTEDHTQEASNDTNANAQTENPVQEE
jgi:AsmA protein